MNIEPRLSICCTSAEAAGGVAGVWRSMAQGQANTKHYGERHNSHKQVVGQPAPPAWHQILH
jgi:hypothetical protein